MPRHLGLIVAWAADRVIGKDGTLPWREPKDLQHFKRVTMGHVMIMGRVCYASIGRALPGRHTIVVTRNAEFEAPGCEVVTSWEAALEAGRARDACPFVVGGAQIYELALPLVTRFELTEIQRDVEGDTWFPDFDLGALREVHRSEAEEGRLVFRTLVR